MTTNNPKVLIELSPEDVKWLSDRLHEEWQRSITIYALKPNKDAENHKKTASRLLNTLLNKAHNQGFGDL